MKDFFRLLVLKWVVACKHFIEYCKVVSRYYPDRKFRKIDLYLLRNYLLLNPYRMSKKFLQKRGEKNIYAYGETPLTTMDLIAGTCGIGPTDIVYELGCGRGRVCFWLNSFKRCRVVGVEFVPTFVQIAAKTGRRYGVSDVKFAYQDILDATLSDATVVYFYGTSADTTFILRLIEKLKTLRSGAKVITVSYPLIHFTAEPVFIMEKEFLANFTWGTAAVYLHRRS